MDDRAHGIVRPLAPDSPSPNAKRPCLSQWHKDTTCQCWERTQSLGAAIVDVISKYLELPATATCTSEKNNQLSATQQNDQPPRFTSLESTPAAFNNVLRHWGIQSGSFEDVLSTDTDFTYSGQVSSIILCSPWINAPGGVANKNFPESLFFLKQCHQESCGFLSVITCVANACKPLTIDETGLFSKYMNAAKTQTPEERGMSMATLMDSLSNDNLNTNMSCSSSVPDTFHYVTFCESKSEIFELDGQRNLPILHGPITLPFPRDAMAIIRQRMANKNVPYSILAFVV